MSGDIHHSQGLQDKPRGLWDGSKLPEVMSPPQQLGQFPAEVPKAPGYLSVHGHAVARVRILAAVTTLIWALQEDQRASKYPANKAVGQREVWGWQVRHGALPIPGIPGNTGWVRAGSESTVKSKHSCKHSLATNSSNMMSLASLMHGLAELTAPSGVPEGCWLQPSPRAPVTDQQPRLLQLFELGAALPGVSIPLLQFVA